MVSVRCDNRTNRRTHCPDGRRLGFVSSTKWEKLFSRLRSSRRGSRNRGLSLYCLPRTQIRGTAETMLQVSEGDTSEGTSHPSPLLAFPQSSCRAFFSRSVTVGFLPTSTKTTRLHCQGDPGVARDKHGNGRGPGDMWGPRVHASASCLERNLEPRMDHPVIPPFIPPVSKGIISRTVGTVLFEGKLNRDSNLKCQGAFCICHGVL